MKNKIIYISIFLIAVLINVHNFTDVFGDTAIPKFRPFGTSTTFADSTDYVNLNKGLNIPNDSLKVGKYLIVGGKGGGIYLDTNKAGEILYNGTDLLFRNGKDTSNTDFSIQSESQFRVMNSALDTALFRINSAGESRFYGGIVVGAISTTSQLKIPSDTASDYDANDAITLNRQSGIITTKSLTTATDNFYTFTLTNSLITTTSKVFVSYCGGTESAGRPTVYRVVSNSGSATCILLNLAGAGSFNGNVKLNFVVFN